VGNKDHDELAEVGRLLFGERWQSDLARALGTSARMVRYWVAGTHTRPEDLGQRLAALLQDRVNDIMRMIVRIQAPRTERRERRGAKNEQG